MWLALYDYAALEVVRLLKILMPVRSSELPRNPPVSGFRSKLAQLPSKKRCVQVSYLQKR